MVLTNSTIEAINLVKDIEFEYNIKLILILTLYAYAILMLVLSLRLDLDWFWWKIVKVLFRVISIAWIFLLPLFWLLLLRTVSFEVIYLYLVGMYSISFSVITVLFFVGFAEFAGRMFGFDIKPSRMKISRKISKRLYD